jgi:putative membrane protein
MEAKLTDTKPQITLSDVLATERTIMANERTFLAYCRTAFSLFIAGLSLMEFTTSKILIAIGILFIPLGVGVFIFGLWRFTKKKKAIRADRYLLGKR